MGKIDIPGDNTFVFRKHDNVGSAAAEEDDQFLDDCFLDTGDLSYLIDCKNPKRIIVGRTGTGKSALIHRLARSNGNVIQLSPHDLSLNFIATNKVIAFFEAAVVELLKEKFNIVNENSHHEFMRRIKSILYAKDRIKEQAVEYLEQWGDKFWLTTEKRIHELTERVEKSLTGAIDGKLPCVNISAEGAKSLSSEQRHQVIEHGLDAVSKVQIRELDNIIAVLADEVFDDPKEHHYVTIDMLDEHWADERIKFKLIRALIDTVRRFKAVPNVKVILAIRQDLLDKIIRLEAVAGFQEEKFKSLYLNLQWNQKELRNLAECRINLLIRRRYTKGDVSFADVFPSNVDSKETFEYLLERTFYRPRDIIMFLNECLELAEGKTAITASIIKKAEERYSIERLQSLAYEWNIIYPNLAHTVRLFQGSPDHIEVSEFKEQFVEERYAEIAADITDVNADPITRSLDTLYTAKGNFSSVRNFVLREFYVTGLIGIKTGPTATTCWARQTAHARLGAGEVRGSSVVCIHPMFHRALGIRYSR